jgi:WhiB family redox-sensing transcriptional regulator
MAACQHVPTELFFPIGHGPAADAQAEVAKSVCGTCPVKVSCLEYALATNVQYGVFGGLTEEERREVRRRVARRHGLELSQLGRLGDLCQLLDLAGLAELGPFAVLGDDDRLEESA